MIPKLSVPFSVKAARDSATLRFSNGKVEHFQGESDAFLFAACDYIEKLEAEKAALVAVARAAASVTSEPSIQEAMTCYVMGITLLAEVQSPTVRRILKGETKK